MTEEIKPAEQPEAQPTSLVERAEKAALAIKEQNDRHEILVKQQEENRLKTILGGGTDSGQRTQSKVETDEEYTEKFLKGEVNPLKENANKGKA